jgi:predicted XRE-type DNA-binding protein
MARSKIEKSSGNVYEDLGFPDASIELAKAELARQIVAIISERNLKQVDAAEVLGIDQPKVSMLVRGRLGGFSLERLFKFLNALGCFVEIVPKRVHGRQVPIVKVLEESL